MLTIRKAQFAAFTVAANPRLHAALTAWVLERFPNFEDGDQRRVESVVAQTIYQAQGLGITEGNAMAYFVGCRVLMGFGFHTHPLVRAILADESIPANGRAASLALGMSEKDLQTVAAWCTGEN